MSLELNEETTQAIEQLIENYIKKNLKLEVTASKDSIGDVHLTIDAYIDGYFVTSSNVYF